MLISHCLREGSTKLAIYGTRTQRPEVGMGIQKALKMHMMQSVLK